MRAAAADFRTARLLGVRANSTIFVAVAPLRRARGDRRGADDRRDALRARRTTRCGTRSSCSSAWWSAGSTACGAPRSAASRSASRPRRSAASCPATGSWPFTSGVYLDSAVFALVILDAAAAAGRSVRRAQAPRGRARMRRGSLPLAGPVALLALVGLLGQLPVEPARDRVRERARLRGDRRRRSTSSSATPACSRSARSASSSSAPTPPASCRSRRRRSRASCPSVFPVIRDHSVWNVWSLVIAAAVGGLFAFLVGIPLMRLSGLAAGIATFAVLEITQNIVGNWEKIGPGPLTLSTVPRDDRPVAGHGRRDRGRVRRVRLPAQPARPKAARDARGSVRRAGGGDRRPPAAALGVHALRRAVGLRRRPVHPLPGDDQRPGRLPRLHVPDPGDARRRRLAEPVGRRRRRARDQRPRLVPRRRRERTRCQLAARPRRARRWSSSPRSWRRARSSCRAG